MGFIGGFLLSLTFWRVWPFIYSSWFVPVDRIGYIGDYPPDLLPLNIQKSLSQGLTDISENGNAIPALADWWEATDSGKRYLFHIRSDFKWHNGLSVLAQDVNYNIKDVTFRVLSPEIIEAELSYPYSPFPIVVSKPLFKKGLVGFGDYRVGNINFNGERVRLIRLLPTRPDLDATVKEYRFYPTESQAVLAYKMGEIDSIVDISNPNGLTNWGKNKILERVRYDRVVALFFNMKNDLLSQKDLRKALAYATPPLPYEPASSPISRISWAHSGKAKVFKQDEETARDLLTNLQIASASPELTISTFSQYIADAQMIADAWTKVGIATAVRVESSIPSDFQILLSAMELPPDPDQYPFWHSTQITSNITGYSNVKIDKLLEDGRQELDPEKRKIIYADFERRLVDDLPVIFLYYPISYTIKRK
jgi:peptide/nickel transport system substrate-binding protein